MQYLNHSDQIFIRYCNNSSVSQSLDELSKDYQVIRHLFNKRNTLESNKSMLELFRKISWSNNLSIYNSISDYIVDMLIKNFLAAKNDTLFPKDMFSADFIKYLVDSERFFDKNYHDDQYSLFDIIILSEDTINYFNFKLSIDYVEDYINIANEYYQQLNTFLYTYDAIKTTEVISYYNYIILISKLLENNSNIERELSARIIETHVSLYIQILNTLLDCIRLNDRLLESSPYLSENLASVELLTTEKNKSAEMVSDLVSFNNPFFKHICQLIENDNYLDVTQSYSSSIISLIPNLLNKQFKTVVTMNNDIFNRLNENIRRNIEKIINHIGINIHDKVKYIKDGNIDWFQEKAVCISLIRVYREIEKYSENNGFQEKTKVRYSIINILDKLNNVDWIKDISQSDISDFFTLLIYEFNSALSSFITHKKNYENMRTFQYIYRDRFLVLKYKITLVIEQINLLYKYISKLIKNETVFSLTNVLSKLCELYSNLFLCSYTNNLYIFSEIFRRSYGNIRIDSEYIIYEKYDHLLSEFYYKVFSDFYELTKNDSFIKFHIQNIEFYNEKCMKDTSTKFEYLPIIKINDERNMTISEIIEVFIQKINECKSIGEQYVCDIPNEFLDPIMMCPIINPVEIPETHYIVEESVIMNHLVFSETNPFTRSKLTKDMLIEYNRNEDVTCRRQSFIEKFNKWKQDNKV